MKQKPRNNPILSMIYAIDNSLEIKNPEDLKESIKNMGIKEWIHHISEYHSEKVRSQSDRVSFGHYGEWFTPDILSHNFVWEKI